MLYYNEYSGQRYVRAYDEEKAALTSWGKYSRIPVIMPDGEEAIPAQYFGTDTPESIFIPWGIVRGELWPGEY